MTGPVVQPVEDGGALVEAPLETPVGTLEVTAVATEAGTASRSVFAPLRIRDYRLLLLTQMAIGLTQPLLFFTQGWYVNLAAPEGREVLYLGALGALRGLAFIAYITVGGTVSDRFPRRRVLRISQSVAVVLIVGIGGLLFIPAVREGQGWTLPMMMVIFASFGITQAQDAPNRTALLRDAVPAPMMTGAISLFMLAMSSALLVAAPFAGFAIERWGIATTYTLAALGPLVVLAVALRLRIGTESADIEGRSVSFAENIRVGLRVLRDEPVVRWTVLLTWIATAGGLSVMGVLVAAWVRQVLHLDATGWGLMALCWGAGSLVSMLWLTSRGDVSHKGPLFLGSALLFGASILGFSLSRSIPVAFFFNGMAGLFFMAYQTVSLAIVSSIVPNRVLGRVTGLLLLGGGLMQLWALAMGALAQIVGLEVVYVAAGAGIVAAAALVILTQAPLRRVN